MRKLVILSPEQGETVSQHTSLQYKYTYGGCIEPKLNESWIEKADALDGSHPEGITIRWKNPFRKSCTLFLADNKEFRNAKKWEAHFRKKVYNLVPGREYFVKVVCGKYSSEMLSFSVACHLPRYIHVPGVSNVRDLGGWKCKGGRKIRFGMIFRGAQHEKWAVVKGITPAGKKVFTDDLKLNTVLDLRWWTEGKNVLEKDVKKYVKIPILAYATWKGPTDTPLGIFTEEQMDHVKKIFLLLAQKNSYPLYFHCQGGGDRTGTIAFLLEIVLGMSLEDAEKEYEYSNLSISGIRLRVSEVWTAFMKKLDGFAPGESIQAKVENYLFQCGVQKETLEAIRNILLEEDV